ncbi:MAG TPA: hypothetical protein VF215_15365, partial [Thermoanaerobaculia bacterium]
PAPQPHRNNRPLPDGWQAATGSGVGEIVVEVAAKGRVEAIASDTGFGFPTAGAALLRARQESCAMPIQDGDVTITRTRATF